MGKKNKDSLGRALIKDRYAKNRNRRHVEDNTLLHTTEVNDGYDWGRLNLQSVTAESSLQEFLSTAELANREFVAEKLNVKYVKSAPCEVELVTSQPEFDEPLTVPRRPPWKPGITAEEQITRERDAFLEWRRHLNELQTKLGAAVTPYERNLELWKQLWRTLEKSDVVLILLDARNPLLFRCLDLEKYASEQNCKCILLLNKADLTTEYTRKCWAEYFEKQNIPIIFFSAAKSSKERKISEDSQTEKDEIDSGTESAESEEDTDGPDDPDEIKQTEDDIEQFKRQLGDLNRAVNNTANKIDAVQEALDRVMESLRLGIPIEPFLCNPEKTTDSEQVDDCDTDQKEDHTGTDNKVENSHEIFGRDKLLEVLKTYKGKELKNPPRITVGMIGYPNVGKSSSVNVLMQTKKVSVSSMPGHTRHIQSLIVDSEVEVLDCPGLVLPAYAVAPDLLLTAVLPIDQMRSHDAAMARLCQLVSRHVFSQRYGLLLPEYDDTSMEYKKILTAHAFNRGFMTAAGQPDVSRSARLLLKDAASGRLRWEQPPPGTEPATLEQLIHENKARKPTPREARAVEGWMNKSAEIDSAFFAMQKGAAHVKGKPILGISSAQAADRQVIGKPWKHEKRHANKNKREKLRRVYAHLDEH
ncbi:large subunit GTPase 1 homolog [Danaus plexippus]|uniref:large subunit GTPase 1 homolog n=1 Tax=Danaus plexippus TaxID=13037 RepID=UPI002AB292AB|nr:large subunit GTPase 1 homolog [Danaus plexippus]